MRWHVRAGSVLCSATLLAGGAGLALAGAGGAPLAALATQVQARGTGGSLPPMLAHALGLQDKGGPLPVRQAVLRQAGDVHVYNVAEGAGHAIVLLHVSTAEGTTEAFLVGEGGALARAVAYAGSGDAEPLPDTEAQAGFEREARLWQAYASGRGGSGR